MRENPLKFLTIQKMKKSESYCNNYNNCVRFYHAPFKLPPCETCDFKKNYKQITTKIEVKNLSNTSKHIHACEKELWREDSST